MGKNSHVLNWSGTEKKESASEKQVTTTNSTTLEAGETHHTELSLNETHTTLPMKYEIEYSQRVYWNFVVDFTEERWMEYIEPDRSYTAEDLQEIAEEAARDNLGLTEAYDGGKISLESSRIITD